MLAAYRILLPREWRQENVHVRQTLAREEYPFLSQSDRKPRLLEDLWVQLSGLTPYLVDILATIPQLKKMKGRQRVKIAAYLRSEFQQFYRDFTSFTNSSPVMEVVQSLPSLSIAASKHRDCCPQSSFLPRFFHYPPAGIFHLVIQCLKIWIWFCLYPSLRAELDFELEVKTSEDQDVMSYSLELCKTFAGIEHQFDQNPAAMVPCFVPMILAAISGPPNIRPWILSKLRHFEEQGQFCNNSIKRNLAVLWNMPEIATEGLRVFLPDNSSDTLVVGEINGSLGNVNLNHEKGNIDDDGFEALAQLRGVFGLQDK